MKDTTQKQQRQKRRSKRQQSRLDIIEKQSYPKTKKIQKEKGKKCKRGRPPKNPRLFNNLKYRVLIRVAQINRLIYTYLTAIGFPNGLIFNQKIWKQLNKQKKIQWADCQLWNQQEEINKIKQACKKHDAGLQFENISIQLINTIFLQIGGPLPPQATKQLYYIVVMAIKSKSNDTIKQCYQQCIFFNGKFTKCRNERIKPIQDQKIYEEFEKLFIGINEIIKNIFSVINNSKQHKNNQQQEAEQ